MSYSDVIAIAGGWEGYRVAGARTIVTSDAKRIEVELIALSQDEMVCGSCGGRCTSVHETTKRVIRDLPILDAQTYLIVHRRRLLCPQCGPTLERLSWLAKYARVTRRLAESVARLCGVVSVKHVAQYLGLSWDQVKEIDKRSLTERVGTVDLSNIEVLGMDEFALHKGHRYATVIIEPYRKEVLWIGKGRSRESIRPFFTQLGPHGCKRLKAVVMDMNASYEEEIKQHSPQADIVYDLFHVVAKYGREVIDRVRVDEANRLKEDKKARKVVKTSRWLLLRNSENVKGDDMLRLQELLEANRSLLTVYLLKDDLKQLWKFTCIEEAGLFWEQWHQRAMESGIPPLILFARRLKGYLQGILNHCLWPLHTGILEGINNKIKVIKRMAYGFRDHEYFFLKIRAAFPGIPG
ncbi:transposase of ISGme5, ISL3 family [Geobacter metallireducens GS-15]|uniref:Transposase of ISGme5, ISL3 family n=2 Tax=Geobacter metallireducens TaxID=28232 RepID=Q39W28_GEOMG|nr:ISL3-like element ISGme5 family transposase [Geobacter metallireducens]ABB30566.1 transposase of ISGme5, ISL3 family [Geobacter metallireducens GS-15]ABB31546.1 transposase of ISGme5, ISL3 family [Geobacter metallireducens GS-15]ABB32736.1 transposase of ISGme5, ISL3 family [Geobacter metallireducens GS-15]ABB33732.1 transposase of ISGme5, ISL3 family [Geobacter metallireducens GS-15]